MFYADVYYDKADLSYCFFKLGCELLKKKGYLIFVTSRYFAQSHYAVMLRRYLLKNFKFIKIVDFYGLRPFKGVGIDPMILYLQKGQRKNGRFRVIKPSGVTKQFNIKNEKNAERFYMPQRILSENGFSFINEKQRAITEIIEDKCTYLLDDIAETFQGIISGEDRAFIINSDGCRYDDCIKEY